MKTLLIVRGHSGSGKSTYAKEQVALRGGVHFENDKFLYSPSGEYVWSSNALAEAIRKCTFATEQAMKDGIEFIAVSNVFSTEESVVAYLRLAKQYGYQTRVSVCGNWCPNEHNVPFLQTVRQFLKIRAEPIIADKEQEYVTPDVFQTRYIQKLINVGVNKNLPLDYNFRTGSFLNSFTLDSLEVLDLITRKTSTTHPYLQVVKYKHQVFYSANWNEALLECRGIVVDLDANIVVRPFNKVFNFSEYQTNRALGTLFINLDSPIHVVEKINGFLGVATFISKYNRVIYSTTGSLDSSFAKLVKKHLQKYEYVFKAFPDHSFMFEICDESDPHIIQEQLGAYLIGVRCVKYGNTFTEEHLDLIANENAILRPIHFYDTWGSLLERVKLSKIEGYMVYFEGKIFKIKTPFYLITKLLARGNVAALESKLSKHNVDEEYYPLIDYIQANLSHFKTLNEQQKVSFIRAFLTGGNDE